MFEEVSPSLYRIEVPLPGSPLKATNSYVVKGADGSLVIDTGWNQEDCMMALISGLEGCGVDLRQADFFITHMHPDHSGLVPNLATEGARIYLGRAEAEIMNSGVLDSWGAVSDFARKRGFPEEQLQKAIEGHPARRHSMSDPLNLCVLRGGDTISIGDYLFVCIETPGHTRGHVCLYEPARRILISGDHVLVDITPSITLSSEERNPLNEYLMSLDKVHDLDVELVLPGHRSIFKDHKNRIQKLKQHHQRRLDEVISILEKGKQNVFQIASQMTWDVDYKSWDLLPPVLKWFSFGEAMAHLKYLEEQGKVGRETQGQGVAFFSKTSNA